MRNVLHLVQKYHWLFTIQLQMGFQQTVKVFRLEFSQTLILKVHKQNLVPSLSFRLQLTHALIQQIRLARMSHANYHIIAILFKVYGTVHNHRLIYFALLTNQALFDDIFTNTHINCI